MYKKIVVTMLAASLLIGLFDTNVYGAENIFEEDIIESEELLCEEVPSEPEWELSEEITEEPSDESSDGFLEEIYDEPDDEVLTEESDIPEDICLQEDELSLVAFSLKNLTGSIKIHQGVRLEYNVTLSSGSAKVYPEELIGSAGANDVIVKVTTEDGHIIGIDPENNVIYGDAVGSTTVSATAYLKRDKEDISKHITDTKEVSVFFPKGEIVEDVYGRRTISFDGENEYQGWVKPLKGGKYEASRSIVQSGSYFIKEGDLIDCAIDTEHPDGRKEAEDLSSMARDCAVWIKEGTDYYQLYKFDSDGKILKNNPWFRLKELDVDTSQTITVCEGDRYVIDVNYIPENTVMERALENINDNKSVSVTSSNPDKVAIGNIKYNYGKNDDGAKTILSCEIEIIGTSVLKDTDPDVEITIISGDEDNKYRDEFLVKTVKVRTVYAEGFKDIDGNTFFIYADGSKHEGWYPSDVNRKYYFYTASDEEKNLGSRYVMASGAVCELSVGDETGYFNFDNEGNFLGDCRGWQSYNGHKVYFTDEGRMAEGGVLAIAGKKYLFKEAPDSYLLVKGAYEVNGKIYYVDKNGALITGWQKVVSPEDASRVKRKYYFDPQNDGALATGFVTVNSKTYYLYPDFSGHYKGQIAKGYLQGIDGKNYYFDSNGVMKTGWQKITVSGVKSWHYFSSKSGESFGMEIIPSDPFNPIDPMGAVGKSYCRSITEDGITVDYYFPNGKTPYVYTVDSKGKVIKSGKVVVKEDKNYFVNEKGNLVKGWARISANGVTAWHYFSITDGTEIEIDEGNVITAADNKSKWRKVDGMTFYFPSDKSVAKGFKDIKDENKVKHKYYFNTAYGNMLVGDFAVGKAYYHANDNGRLLLKCYNDAGNKYYNSSGKMVCGFLKLNKKTYYFGSDGLIVKGIANVNGKKYLLDSTTGELLKKYYGDMDSKKYMTNSSGVLLSGWQRIKVGGIYGWHYFSSDDMSEVEINPGDVVTATDGKSKWRSVNGMTFYFPSDKSVAKGFKTIKDENGVKQKYYFDKSTGRLLTGKITVGKTNYYMNEDGEQVKSDFVKINGKYYYLDKNGSVLKKWFTVSGKKYYADPGSGSIFTGFHKIDNKLFYFSETGASAGQMQTGFFRVPDVGQNYFDEEGSNIYYALSGGEIKKGGWINVKNGSSSDSQEWSYYLNPAITGRSGDGNDISGEVVTGNVIIGEDGIALKYESGDMSRMYSFDEKTGARKKAVLYFHGGSYTESLMSADQKGQYNTMMSIATYMNTDRKLTSPSEMMILAGYTDLSKLGISMSGCYSGTSYPNSVTNGTEGFPVAACYNVESERSAYNPKYDIAKYNQAGGTYDVVTSEDDRDGAVDIGDIEVFSFDLYCKVIEKFGPNNVVLMGASSGGATALSLLSKANGLNIALPSETILYSPWIDASMSNPNSKKYSSRGVDYSTLLYKGARVTRDAAYKNGNPYGADGVKGPGAKSPAAWFASPALSTSGCNWDGVKNVTIYTGTKDPCYPDIANFAAAHGGMVTLKKTSAAGHCYMFESGGNTVLKTAGAIMTQSTAK